MTQSRALLSAGVAIILFCPGLPPHENVCRLGSLPSLSLPLNLLVCCPALLPNKQTVFPIETKTPTTTSFILLSRKVSEDEHTVAHVPSIDTQPRLLYRSSNDMISPLALMSPFDIKLSLSLLTFYAISAVLAVLLLRLFVCLLSLSDKPDRRIQATKIESATVSVTPIPLSINTEPITNYKPLFVSSGTASSSQSHQRQESNRSDWTRFTRVKPMSMTRRDPAFSRVGLRCVFSLSLRVHDLE